MAKHTISMRQPKDRVMNVDVEFVIKENGKKLGELHISKGNIQWIPKNGRLPRKMRWSQFAQLMSEGKQVH